MATLSRKKPGTSHNPQLADVLDAAKKEKVIPLHVQLPESLMKRLKMYAAEHGKTLREIIIESIEKKV